MLDIDHYLDFGFPLDQVKFVLCMLFSYPMAMVLRSLPNASTKHMMSIALGIFYCHFSLGAFSWIHSFASSLVCYIMVSVLPRRVSHIWVFVFAMAYLSISHWYRMYTDYMGWTMDFTSPQMVLTLKLTSFAWNLYDGSRPATELTSDQQRRSIKKVPSLLEFFGFIYFFPTFLAGPTIEIGDYLRYTSGLMFKDGKSNGIMPSPNFASLRTFVYGILCFPLIIIGGTLNMDYLLTSSFANEPLLWQAHLHVMLTRFKYYFGWYMSEGSAVLSGISFNGYDSNGNAKWDRLTNVYPIKVELASNVRDVSTYWNMGTADWLKTYVYLRLTPVGTKPTFGATLATYATSAFWHGFYPGYYIFFISTTFLTEVAKDIRRKIRPFFVSGAEEKPIQPWKKLYDIVGVMVTAWWLNFLGASFLLLSLERTLVFWGVFRFIPLIMLVGAFILLRFFVPAPKVSRTPRSA
ncbi:membrane bound O-acyl transferase family protein [Heterostelium album PN500]|uniref:Membrane bound O-acyl transferase family protein n=1 Tax=Heterostelium pallidum (strain ATCC 26659 / Pp 5 / PN500) TaxID=670386 RepID=D3BJR6_HETP5|nr:membrane bound O-acyl transferase family protein [Heterostelium album PN500]EFA78146.1 membrane bound O-acyl transferase family protein [Heterostelium album PN500]|eukprot:XP_020430272.1 membrane bound O-acyl transferase family protein [Heterostelium album PN500]